MPRPKKPPPDSAFITRLRELSDRLGSLAELARQARIAGPTLQNYLEGGEPTRNTLVALARAGNVSVNWLATGWGNKQPDDLPEGYSAASYFDLRAAEWRVYPFFDKPAGFIVFKDSWLPKEPPRPPLHIVAFESGEKLDHIQIGDLILMEPKRSGIVPTPNLPPWPEALVPGAAYVVAREARVLIRYLFRGRSGKSVIARASGKKDFEVEAGAPNFQILGLVLWRGGAVISFT